jgi:transposase
MAPNLKPAKRILIRDMIKDGGFKNEEIAEAASCTDRTVKAIDRNLRLFGSTTAPPNRGGRPRSITPAMLDSLLEHLGPEPDLYLEEMVEYFWREFRVCTTKSGISRTLRSAGWSKNNIRRVAKERNAVEALG